MVAQLIKTRVYPSLDFVSSFTGSLMGLSNAQISHKPLKCPSDKAKQRKGLKGISSEERRRVRSACALLEELNQKHNLSLLTCTVPSMTKEKLLMIALNWSEIVRQYIQALQRLIKSRGGDENQIICVTELQEKRYETYGVPVPHLHILFKGRGNRYAKWVISKDEARTIWQRILSNFLGYVPDCCAATRIESIKFSVKRYLSKYMSKGGKVLQELIEKGWEDYIPHSWTYMSKTLRNTVNAAIRELDAKRSEFIADNAEFLKNIGVLSWYKVIELEFTDWQTNFVHTRKVGIVGSFNDSKPLDEHLRLIDSFINYGE